MRIAVIFPGIGYNKDMPLLYYSRKMVEHYCSKTVCVDYHDLPTDVKGDPEKMWKAANFAYAQVSEQLKDIDFSEYSDIVFIGKSMGSVIAAEYATEHNINAMQIWLKVIPDCDHSLEHKWFTVDKELDVLRSVMATMDGRLSFYLTRDVF